MDIIIEKDLKVIDDDLIVQSYVENLKESKNENEKKELIKKFKTFTKLVFSYKNIYKIQGLRGLERLEVLKLDNNFISKIENLSELRNLKSLDLSFNKIKKIENLENLENLTDLSLYHNEIEEIHYEELKNLKKLSLLSLSHNSLKNIIELLRAIKPIYSLEVLTITNNPLTNDSEYKNYIFANMPKLKYLDYIYIYERVQQTGFDDYKYKTDFEGNFDDNQKRESLHSHDKNDELFQKLNKYHLQNYDDYLLSEIDELETLRSIPGSFEESFHKINESMKNLLEDIKNNMTEIIKNKENMVVKFESAFQLMIKKNEQECLEFLRIYQKKKKNLIIYIEETKNKDKVNKIEEIVTYLQDLEENLVKKEMILNNRLNDSYKELEKISKDIFKELIDSLAGEKGLKNVEDYLSKFFAKFTEEALKELMRCENDRNELQKHENFDNIDNEEDEGPWTQEQIALLESQDDLKNTINNIKETVENKHRKIDGLIRKDIEMEKSDYLSKISKSIVKLNRNNIYNLVMLMKEEMNFWIDKKNMIK